jgi:hypothetical protein
MWEFAEIAWDDKDANAIEAAISATSLVRRDDPAAISFELRD